MSRGSLPLSGGGGAVRQPRAAAPRQRLPDWFRTTLPTGDALRRYQGTRANVADHALHTVCEEARCPNIHECWSSGDATFMIAGQVCTRGCRFCHVGTQRTPPPLNPGEPAQLAAAVAGMTLDHVVITVVNRDDLPDSGAAHYRACVDAVHERTPEVTIELLSSDLTGDLGDLADLLHAAPLAIFAHNVECVPRLDPIVRDPRATFGQSLAILTEAKRLRPDIPTKSSLMLGLGETHEEIEAALVALRAAGVDLVTLGQYLQPSARHLTIDRYVEPAEFDHWAERARTHGFAAVASGPMVRSSYQAGRLLAAARDRLPRTAVLQPLGHVQPAPQPSRADPDSVAPSWPSTPSHGPR